MNDFQFAMACARSLTLLTATKDHYLAIFGQLTDVLETTPDVAPELSAAVDALTASSDAVTRAFVALSEIMGARWGFTPTLPDDFPKSS